MRQRTGLLQVAEHQKVHVVRRDRHGGAAGPAAPGKPAKGRTPSGMCAAVAPPRGVRPPAQAPATCCRSRPCVTASVERASGVCLRRAPPVW
jgi:hypothetical protein